MPASVIGIDLAKNVFQVHGVDDAGRPLLLKQLRREQMMSFFAQLPTCLVGMEAIHGARSALRTAHRKPIGERWLNNLVERRHRNIAAVALANKNARIRVGAVGAQSNL